MCNGLIEVNPAFAREALQEGNGANEQEATLGGDQPSFPFINEYGVNAEFQSQGDSFRFAGIQIE